MAVSLRCLPVLRRVALLLVWGVSLAVAYPTSTIATRTRNEKTTRLEEGPDLVTNLIAATVLVLVGGLFAGLTIALMGQDAVHLQVIASSGEGREKKQAAIVLKLLNQGKHWVLVTLLLGNVVVNETLPLILDETLGGGWMAVLGSTVLIVIFGEVIPQSICVRYGLPIGATLSPLVFLLMCLFAPVAWPTAKLLDWLLGENHGVVYKKAGLKTLVSLHGSLGKNPDERLNEDEVTIISAVLDLKAKAVRHVMTPMEHVFIMPSDTILDEKTVDLILTAGFSRIPIHTPNDPSNFIGMLLVKTLITYDPEDAQPVGSMPLATLPETRPETSCLDILNYFQEGHSHMILVSEDPGGDAGALGVITLEDVVEELIGEEIVDESDIYVDVPKSIKRLTPAPRITQSENGQQISGIVAGQGKFQSAFVPAGQRLRRRSTAPPGGLDINGSGHNGHSEHLMPSNLASSPKQTKSTVVKIKRASVARAQSSEQQGSRTNDETTPLLDERQ